MEQVNKIWFPKGDHAFTEIVRNSGTIDGFGTYQIGLLLAGVKRCKKYRTVIDVGAHVGLWSRILADKFRFVEAFEPSPELIKCFRLNVPQDNVSLWEMAAGAQLKSVGLKIKSGNSGITHIDHDGDSIALMTPLDECKFSDVDLIKIDVEGYEESVLDGALKTIIRDRPVVICEYYPGLSERRFGLPDGEPERMLLGMGYKIDYRDRTNFIAVP